MLKAFLIAALFAALFAARPQGDCRCAPAAESDVTRWGGNEEVVGREEKTYRRLAGGVRYATDEAVSGALVEVYTHPEYLLLKYPENAKKRKRQRRVAACVTGEDGKFCFGFVGAGKYEVRVSKDGGFNVTHIYVEVDPFGVESVEDELDAVLTPGT